MGSCGAVLVESLEPEGCRCPGGRVPGNQDLPLRMLWATGLLSWVGGGVASGRPGEPVGEDLPETLLCRCVWRCRKEPAWSRVRERLRRLETVCLRES